MCATPNGTFLRSFFLNCFFLPVFFSGAAAPPPAAAAFAILCLRRRFLFVRYRALARTFARAGVGVRALSALREVAAMAISAIGADFDEPLDVHRNILAQIAFDVALRLNHLADAIDLVFVEVLNLLVGIDLRGSENAGRPRIADAVDISERDVHVLIARKIDACNACHKSSWLLAAGY